MSMNVETKKSTYTDQVIEVAEAEIPESVASRKESWTKFKALGFPEPKNEEYKFTPVTKTLARYFDSNELFVRIKSNLSSVNDPLITELNASQLVFSNGNFLPELSNIPEENGITVEPLKDALTKHAEIIQKALLEVPESSDPFALLNETIWQDGLFVRVSRNKSVEKPLVIYHHHDAGRNKVSTHTKLIILVEENASLSIIEKTNSSGDNAVFNTIQEQIIVGENANLTYYKIQSDPGQLIQVTNTTIHQSKSSRTNTYTFSLDGKLLRNNLNIIIDGEGCESHFYGLYLTNSDSLVDNHTVVDHRKPNSFSNELYKGLMDDKSKGVFNGKIFVRPHAQKTNAFQSNRNILLSDTATINTKPQLEIWADDVKCSHGCTTGQLDEEALFYLRSRGIPKETAKAMLLYAFAGEVLDAIGDIKIRSHIDQLISDRLHKNF